MAFKRATPSHEWWGIGVLFVIGIFVFLTISFFPMENITYNGKVLQKGDKDFSEVQMETRWGFRIGSLFCSLAAVFCFKVSRHKKAKEERKEGNKNIPDKKSTTSKAKSSVRTTFPKSPRKANLNPRTRKKINRLVTENRSLSIPHKKIDFLQIIKIFFACFATHVASIILLGMVMVTLGAVGPLDAILGLWAHLGWILIFLIFWPIYSEKLR